jgi:hypothetical protein
LRLSHRMRPKSRFSTTLLIILGLLFVLLIALLWPTILLCYFKILQAIGSNAEAYKELAAIDKKSLQEFGPIGDTFNGFLAPIISLISALIVYYALREQRRANTLFQDYSLAESYRKDVEKIEYNLLKIDEQSKLLLKISRYALKDKQSIVDYKIFLHDKDIALSALSSLAIISSSLRQILLTSTALNEFILKINEKEVYNRVFQDLSVYEIYEMNPMEKSKLLLLDTIDVVLDKILYLDYAYLSKIYCLSADLQKYRISPNLQLLAQECVWIEYYIGIIKNIKHKNNKIKT